MKVTLVARTILNELPDSIAGTKFDTRVWNDPGVSSTDVDLIPEFGGRACYQAWELANPKTADNKGYLANIIEQGHFSVLEHSSVTFYIEGVSRSLTHELIRHRHLSYSELSQRYVDVENAEVITPPAIRDKFPESVVMNELPSIKEARWDYANLVEDLMDFGLPRKRAREAARAVMPNAIETKIVLSGNLRAFRDMLYKRWHVAADAEIRELAGELLRQLKVIAPNSFQDFPDEPFGS
jgi:thymidylate synthase (FAD)